MGRSGKGKHMKGKGKSMVGESDYVNRHPGNSNSHSDVGHKKSYNQVALKKLKDKSSCLDINANDEMSRWRNNTEDEFEKLLYDKFCFIYDEAYQKLLAMGYQTDVAQKAILMNGHGRGYMHIFANIVTNSISYINSGCVTDKIAHQGYNSFSERVLSLLEMMINLLQDAWPTCSRSDAMKHLLTMDTGAGTESSMHLQSVQSENQNMSGVSSSGDNHGKQNADALLHMDLRLPKRFNLTPAVESLLKKNVQSIANIYRPEMEPSPTYSEALRHLLARREPALDESDILRIVDCSEEWSLEEWMEREPDDSKNELIMCAILEYRAHMVKVKERKEWAREKAMQLEKKFMDHISELSMLRTEKLINDQMKIDKEVLQEKNMKRFFEMENAVMHAQFQVNFATDAVRRLEIENSTIRAALESYNLSASESSRALREVNNRERRCMKSVAAIEKESRKLQERIEEENQKVGQLNQELLQLNKAQEDAEEKLREQSMEKELAVALLREEDRLKKSAKANLRSKKALLHGEMEMSQFLKDDIHRLEEELSNVRISENNSFEMALPESFIFGDSSGEELFSDRQCVLCSKNEASILFLPCAHQLLCLKCNEEKTVGAVCPCCLVQIEQRVSVFGAS